LASGRYLNSPVSRMMEMAALPGQGQVARQVANPSAAAVSIAGEVGCVVQAVLDMPVISCQAQHRVGSGLVGTERSQSVDQGCSKAEREMLLHGHPIRGPRRLRDRAATHRAGLSRPRHGPGRRDGRPPEPQARPASGERDRLARILPAGRFVRLDRARREAGAGKRCVQAIAV